MNGDKFRIEQRGKVIGMKYRGIEIGDRDDSDAGIAGVLIDEARDEAMARQGFRRERWEFWSRGSLDAAVQLFETTGYQYEYGAAIAGVGPGEPKMRYGLFVWMPTRKEQISQEQKGEAKPYRIPQGTRLDEAYARERWE